MILLDTHALIWWLNAESTRLSTKLIDRIEDALSRGRLAASAISAWEIALLVARGRLDLTTDAGRWLQLAAEVEGFRFVPVDARIAAASVDLPGRFHADPADRFIVATARRLDAELVTSDAKIRRYPHVRSIW